MRNKMTRITVLILFVALSAFIVACGDGNANGNGNDNNEPNAGNVNNNNNNNNNDNNDDVVEEPKEEITIKWAHQWGEDEFWEDIGDYVQDEFPHITFEVLDAGPDHPDELEDLIVAGIYPDVVSTLYVTHVNILDHLGLAYNHDELIEKTGFDLDRLEPSIVEYARNQDLNKEGGLYLIPNERPTWSLHYDRDVFDILGEDYPEDGMTWEETLELARDLTREVGGEQYRGLDLDVWYDAYSQFSQNSIDPETDEVLIAESEAYRRFLEYAGEVISIPGNYPTDEPSSDLHHWGGKLGDGNIAMYPMATNWGHIKDNENWDIAAFPTWEGYEGLNPVPNTKSWAITETNEHKEETLAVIEFLLSDEVQMDKSRKGIVSPLTNPEVNAVFGDDVPELDGKRLDSLFVNEYATGPEETSKYGDGVLWTAANEFVDSGEDINAFLRILQEQAEENVRAQKESE